MAAKKTKKEQQEGKKPKETIRKWRIGDYIRQLSVVVLGIVVTFCGSDVVNDYSKQKEIRSMMELIKGELKLNQERLYENERKLRKEWKMALLLGNTNFSYQDIPEDTLAYYSTLLTNASKFIVAKNALDVFKNSGLMQHISDKQFILSLSETYDALVNIEIEIRDYYGMKLDASKALYKGGMHINGGIKKLYDYSLSFNEMKSFIIIAPGYIDHNAFSIAYDLLTESIRAIEEKYE